jgi:hypothetical protein
MHKLIAGAAALALMAAATQASAADNANANASANIIVPLAVTSSGALNFGNILQAAAACDVTLSTTAVRGGTCAAGRLIGGSTPTVPTFSVDTDPTGGTTYNLTVANSSIASGMNTMSIDTYTYSNTNTNVAADQNFAVGATLHVGAAQAAGVYTGSITATAVYN